MNPKDSALAVAIVSFCGAVAWVMVTSDPKPLVVTPTAEVTYTVAPTATMTVTAQPSSTPTVTVVVTRTPPISRDQKRETTKWDRLAQCESGGRWSLNVGKYDGGLQFDPQYWPHYAKQAGVDAAYAWQATREQQIRVAELILADNGWGAWPVCSKRIGLR
jgi:hypothetical protein